MKGFVLIISLVVAGCGSSINIPSKEESQQKVSALKPQVDSLEMIISNQTRSLPKGHDLITRTRSSAINLLLARITNRTLKDIHIDFLSTRPLWREEKNVFGINYTNYVDVDTGSLDIDLKNFAFTDFSNNVINAQIEIEGTGVIKASGKYTGISAGVSPRVHFYLNDHIQFTVSTADSDYIRLLPVSKTVHLKTKITITMLGLNVPYYKEIPLQVTDLITPVLIPSAVKSEIIFPIPAPQYGSGRLIFVKRFLRFTKSAVRANDDGIEYRSNIGFEKE